jgi:hypothetical protein
MKIMAVSGLGEQPVDTTGVQASTAAGAWFVILGAAALMFFLTMSAPRRRRRT